MAKFYSRGKGIWFPHIVDDEKKEVYFLIESGFPSTMAVSPIMKEHFPSDYKGYIASPDSWEQMKKNASTMWGKFLLGIFLYDLVIKIPISITQGSKQDFIDYQGSKNKVPRVFSRRDY